MRYRRETATGDYVFGQGEADFFVDEPAAVAQAVKTRLRLFQGEYFVDTTIGMPWQTRVLGYNRSDTYDAAIRQTISQTQGFGSFINYSSDLNKITRLLTVGGKITTVYSGHPTELSVAVLVSGYGIGGYGTRPYGD
jgi:hypothetical protein